MPGQDGGLRRLFRKHLKNVDWTTVESRLTGSGIPDLNGCHGGVEFWIECKLTKGWAVRMRPAQVGWISRRVRAGGRVVVAVRRKGRGVDQLWLVAGEAVATLRLRGLQGLQGVPGAGLLGCWHGGPAGWQWGAILAAAQGANGPARAAGKAAGGGIRGNSGQGAKVALQARKGRQ